MKFYKSIFYIIYLSIFRILIIMLGLTSYSSFFLFETLKEWKKQQQQKLEWDQYQSSIYNKRSSIYTSRLECIWRTFRIHPSKRGELRVNHPFDGWTKNGWIHWVWMNGRTAKVYYANFHSPFEGWFNLFTLSFTFFEGWMSFWKEDSPFKMGERIHPWGWFTLLKGESSRSVSWKRVNEGRITLLKGEWKH